MKVNYFFLVILVLFERKLVFRHDCELHRNVLGAQVNPMNTVKEHVTKNKPTHYKVGCVGVG